MADLFAQNVSSSMHNRSNFNVSHMSNRSVLPSEALGPPLYIVLTSTVLYCLIFLIGVAGNITVIIVISSSKSMKTTVNKYLLNLCIADVLVIIFCMPTALADIYTKEVWYFGEVMCKTVPFLENAVANASVVTILAISIERYRVICYPLKGIDESAVKVWRIAPVIWIISVISSAPWLSIAILRPSTFHDGTPIQVCRNPIVKDWQKIYIVGLAVFFFFVPSFLLMLLNCHLCKAFSKTREYDDCVHANRRSKRVKHQSTNTIASCIVFLFFICHLPFRVAVLWFSFEDKNVIWGLGLEKFLIILYSTRIMFYLNHALNPVIYNFVSSKFRNSLRVLWRKTSWKQCSVFNSIYKRQSHGILKSTRSLTVPQHRVTFSNKIVGTNQAILGQLDETCAHFVPRRVHIECPCDGQALNKFTVANFPCNPRDSSSEGEYNVRIHIEDQSVALKFKLKHISNSE